MILKNKNAVNKEGKEKKIKEKKIKEKKVKEKKLPSKLKAAVGDFKLDKKKKIYKGKMYWNGDNVPLTFDAISEEYTKKVMTNLKEIERCNFGVYERIFRTCYRDNNKKINNELHKNKKEECFEEFFEYFKVNDIKVNKNNIYWTIKGIRKFRHTTFIEETDTTGRYKY